jgi:feruloyl esterase
MLCSIGLALAIGTIALGPQQAPGAQPAGLPAPAVPAQVQPGPPAPGPLPIPPKPVIPGARPVRSCESLASVKWRDTTIDSASVEQQKTGPVCRVTATVTHPPAGDQIKIFVALPMQNWNGRFQATGGGGYAGGSANNITQPADLGYVAAATDTGHVGGSGSFALDATGRLNWQSIRDNAYLGVHQMTVVSKALIRELYGTPPRYSYFNGCSSGGRQGLMEAQRFPDDYDGILAVAPAINWAQFLPADFWPQLVMLEARNFVPACKADMATAAAVKACDTLDGVEDGVLEDPRRCTFDPKTLVGADAGGCGVFTAADASVIQKVWEGPRRPDGTKMWYGLARGAPLTRLAGTTGSPPTGQPFRIALEWLRYFLLQDPSWDWTTLTPERFEQLFDQSVEQYEAVIGTANPDLSLFRKSNGKLIFWHGWSDELIPAEGSIDYYDRVVARMGGRNETEKFVRLFMAPGVGHCGGGPGPPPREELDALLRWVEDGTVPESLPAIRRDPTGAVRRSRPLCPYPQVARFKGRGSTDDAASFECRVSDRR